MSELVMQTEIAEYPLTWRGKVRDIYDLGDTLLFVASDRISAFDVVLPNGIPGKGVVLTKTSLFWFDFFKDVVKSHLVTADVDEYPDNLKKYRSQLEGRSMIVHKAERVDAECIVRGYISGSMWKELGVARKEGKNTVHGFEFASDLVVNVLKYIAPIDEKIMAHSTNWSFERIAKLDVSVMRVAVYELIFTETAPPIIMNEAIEIAKKYCSESSGKFINGVLNAITKEK